MSTTHNKSNLLCVKGIEEKMINPTKVDVSPLNWKVCFTIVYIKNITYSIGKLKQHFKVILKRQKLSTYVWKLPAIVENLISGQQNAFRNIKKMSVLLRGVAEHSWNRKTISFCIVQLKSYTNLRIFTQDYSGNRLKLKNTRAISINQKKVSI